MSGAGVRRAVSRATLGLVGAGAVACSAAPQPAPTPVPAPVATTGAPGASRTSAGSAPTASATRAALVAALDSMLAEPRWNTASWGVLVVHPRTGDTLYSRNAGRFFLPASNQKVLTGTVALARLGADYRWRTVLAVAAPVEHGTVRGDLYVLGSGDPTVSDAMQHGDAMAPLRLLADSLWTRGIRRIEGDVVAAPSGADSTSDSTRDAEPSAGPWQFGWEWDDFDTPSGAGVTELLFNEGVARVTVQGGARAGAPVRLVVRPTPGMLPIALAPAVRTVGRGDSTAAPVRAAWDYDAQRYVVRGTLAAGDSAVLELGVHDPRRAYTGALRDALIARGIVVTGPVAHHAGRARRATATRPLDTLAVLTSAPLREVLPAMEKPSQNQIAEAVFLTLGREGTGTMRADSARRVVGEQLRSWGVVPERDVAVRDGSGLSRHDYVTPNAMVRVLEAARQLPDFRTFYDALPIAGVDGTLGNRLRGTRAAGRVHAKTGTIDRARNLSGYASSADDELLVFALLCNNYATPTSEVTRVQDAIALRLATLRVREAGATLPVTSAAPR